MSGLASSQGGTTSDSGAVRAALPPNEADRIAALRAYEILDTPVEAGFDDITRIASCVCQTPIAVVNFIDSARQWFKSEIGLGVRETELDVSVCAHAILQPGLFIIPDLREDLRFAGNPLVAGNPELRFYAGALLQTPDGHAIGTVCVLDYQPRVLTPEQQSALSSLARQAMTQLELRRTLLIANRIDQHRTRIMTETGHDLKQPLQVISMLLDQIERNLAKKGERGRFQQANAAIDQLATGLDDLAEASRLADNVGIPQRKRVAAAALIAKTVDTWRHHAARNGLELRTVRTTAEVETDPAMLSTLLGNLVGNAIKYTPAGSVLIGCRRRGDFLSIEVVDTGPGIPAERLEEIFEPFFRLQPSGEGLGLGLSIVSRVAAVLGHQLRVRSVLGKGSRFAVEVPLAAARR